MKSKIDFIIRWIGTTSSLITHTLFFMFMFSLRIFGVSSQDVLLILTTVVSLEAIYLSIFIQMSVNRQGTNLKNLQFTVEDVQEAVGDVQEAVEDVQETVEDVQETVEDVQETIEDEENK